jgi:hypothetical protein
MRARVPFVVTGLLASWATAAGAQGWQVSPARQEIRVAAGASRTFPVRIERETQPDAPGEAIRFTIAPGDWDIGRSGEMLLYPPRTMADSACDWATFSPTEFTLKPGAAADVRVTISVPPGTAPGLHRLGLFFEEHAPVPPAGPESRRLVIRYRLSTLVYVVVPEPEKQFALGSVSVERAAAGDVVVHAVLRNPGALHLRPTHWIEVRDAAGRTLLRTEATPTMVLLPGRELEVDLRAPSGDRPEGPVQIRYVVDPGEDLALQAATARLDPPPGG